MSAILLITSLFYFLPIALIDNVKIINTSDRNPESNQLYLNLENDLKIVDVEKLSNYKITSASSNIKIVEGLIEATPYKTGLDTINVYENKKLIFRKIFSIKVADFDPVAKLSFDSDSFITTNQILANPFLVISNPKCSYKFQFAVSFFTLKVIKKNNEEILPISTISGELTEEMLSIVKQLKPGDKILIDGIKYGCLPDFCVKGIKSIQLTIR